MRKWGYWVSNWVIRHLWNVLYWILKFTCSVLYTLSSDNKNILTPICVLDRFWCQWDVRQSLGYEFLPVSVFSAALPASGDPDDVFGGDRRPLLLIDFGQSIDMTRYPPGTTFLAKVKTSSFKCIEMQTDRPWTYQVCTEDWSRSDRPVSYKLSSGCYP